MMHYLGIQNLIYEYAIFNLILNIQSSTQWISKIRSLYIDKSTHGYPEFKGNTVYIHKPNNGYPKIDILMSIK